MSSGEEKSPRGTFDSPPISPRVGGGDGIEGYILTEERKKAKKNRPLFGKNKVEKQVSINGKIISGKHNANSD